jgi:hypothetical protein
MPNTDNEDWSLGIEFAVTSPTEVGALGYNYFGVPLNNSHLVGIFDSSATLLTSATVTNASTPFNGYLYTSVTPLVLAPGDYWLVGTTLGLNDGWTYRATVTSIPSVSFVESWFEPGNGGMLSFPTAPAVGLQYMEVNFLVVPEPGTLALLGTGALAALGVFRRRFMN